MSPAKSTLEVLRVAKASLSDESKPFNFGDPTSCTCGHLYAAFSDRQPGAVSGIATSSRDEFYGEFAIEVASALGWKPDELSYYSGWTKAEDALWFISDETGYASGPSRGEAKRTDALGVIDKAISAIEDHEEQARLQVAS